MPRHWTVRDEARTKDPDRSHGHPSAGDVLKHFYSYLIILNSSVSASTLIVANTLAFALALEVMAAPPDALLMTGTPSPRVTRTLICRSQKGV